MSKFLLCGDVHCVASEIGECENLLELIRKTVRKHNCNVVFLGDQYDGFKNINVEVMKFWKTAFAGVTRHIHNPMRLYALVGNHDMPGNGNSESHAMMAHSEQPKCVVVDSPTLVNNVLFLPYYHKEEDFLNACNQHKDAKTLICHQTFLGVKYDNGFYAKDGIDPEKVPQPLIFSGHIHVPIAFGKVIYPGSPRARTLSDANTERSLMLVEFDDNGNMISKETISTEDYCKQIYYFEDKLGSIPNLKRNPKDDYRIDIVGTDEYIDERRKYYKGFSNVRVRTFPQSTKTVEIKESEGLDKAFVKFLNGFKSRYGTDKDKLKKMAKERLGLDV